MQEKRAQKDFPLTEAFFSVHFSHAREKEPKSALPPRPPSIGWRAMLVTIRGER